MNLEMTNRQIPVETNTNNDASSESLSRRLFSQPHVGQNEGARQPVEVGYRPSADDIDYFIKNEFKGDGLTRNDLTRISEHSKLNGAARKGKIADYLNNHYADVSVLSDEDKGGRISRSDLELYRDLLKYSQVSLNRQQSDLPGWKYLHKEHEIKQNASFRDLGGDLAAVTGAWAMTPLIAPKTTLVRAAIYGAAAVASYFAGREGGDWLHRRLDREKIRRHFIDEAAPAMKRLLL